MGTRSSLYRNITPGYQPTVEDVGRTTGNRWYVDSGSSTGGTTAGFGKHPDKPFTTLDAALGQAVADNGDVIYLLPGHAENVADATTFQVDKAGVRIVGLGVGANRPTFTFTNTAGAVELDASCHVENVVLRASVSAVVVGVNVDADDVTLKRVRMDWDETGDDFVTMVDVDGVNRITIDECEFVAEDTAGCNEAIRLDDCDHVTITRCLVYGDFTDGAIVGEGAAGANLQLHDNVIYNSDTTAGFVLDLNVAFTGVWSFNRCGTLFATAPETAVDPGSLLGIENYVCNAVDESGALVPTTVST